MERLTITITASPDSRDGKLKLHDAMLQVLDLLKLHEDARRAVPMPVEAFVWRLESATANSPFQVVAVADPLDAAADIAPYVNEVTKVFRDGIDDLIKRRGAPWWMDNETLQAANFLFTRNQNGVGETRIEPSANVAPLAILPPDAKAGAQTIIATDLRAIEEAEGEIPSAFGELRGVMFEATWWWKKRAIRIRNDQYGRVLCVLTDEIAREYGHEASLDDLWNGKTVAVRGRFMYARNGRLIRIHAEDVRDVPGVPLVDLDSVVDPDFTSGLDPVEYLRRLHEGELA